MIKSAVVNDDTPCVDSPLKKESGFYDGEKVSTSPAKLDFPKLAKILNSKDTANELEHSKPIQ